MITYIEYGMMPLLCHFLVLASGIGVTPLLCHWLSMEDDVAGSGFQQRQPK
jgi:ferredoxin-NADP reductase